MYDINSAKAFFHRATNSPRLTLNHCRSSRFAKMRGTIEFGSFRSLSIYMSTILTLQQSHFWRAFRERPWYNISHVAYLQTADLGPWAALLSVRRNSWLSASAMSLAAISDCGLLWLSLRLSREKRERRGKKLLGMASTLPLPYTYDGSFCPSCPLLDKYQVKLMSVS